MAFLLLIALFALAWIVLILPKQRELKRHNALVASLEVGDEVMTGSGFYGTLVAIDADTVHLELAEGLVVKLARRAVAAKVVHDDAAAAQHEATEIGDEAEADTEDDGGVIGGYLDPEVMDEGTDVTRPDDREDRP